MYPTSTLAETKTEKIAITPAPYIKRTETSILSRMKNEIKNPVTEST